MPLEKRRGLDPIRAATSRAKLVKMSTGGSGVCWRCCAGGEKSCMALQTMHQMGTPVCRWSKGGVGLLAETRRKVNPTRKVTVMRRTAAIRGLKRRERYVCSRSLT